MRITRILPVAGAGHAAASRGLDDDGTRGWLEDLYRPGSADHVRLNFVASVDGSVIGADGTSDSLSSVVDRRILGVIRELADVVLVGAGTVRAERYVLPRRTPLAVATSSGDLEGHRFDQDASPGRLLVLCPPEARDRAVASLGGVPAEIVSVPLGAAADGRMGGDDVVDALRGRGLTHVVCEGGPALAASLIAAGRVDELCLTTSPELVTPLTPLVPAGSDAYAPMRLDQLLVDDDHRTYARWTVRRD
ncbi:dihydrofolate reductase family protein [Clavibacter sepedonicus]|uniref:Hydrolase n=1 Tax=Clavibacter sepedonicus TaxID=31964 RepID=B0RC31_CLASE|nr:MULTISPECIES: dihydrofolate reductase family protein [Clavibacter]MBD5381707.1 pyrimidine reductase [Clavibacter sp.]OQJ47433.1 pyrimidine reductase [Clavibacter sepedonicus]OQJ52989.1 pyrimidine reductase [Clavibacter sepedonicus]UUK66998.1 dihydrofolate reductase family protein [Clavibacter sepedonicus]CAQ01759.1 putative hydrolase [Clavibacter sepedonicus]